MKIFKYNGLKLYGMMAVAIVALTVYAISGCTDYPIDEDGLLITTRAECYVANFEIIGTDLQTARATVAPVIDTLACTINVVLRYGTDLRNLWPQFSLAEDCKIEPKVTGWMDFSDLSNPTKWTVISGNRKIRNTYTLTLRVQQP